MADRVFKVIISDTANQQVAVPSGARIVDALPDEDSGGMCIVCEGNPNAATSDRRILVLANNAEMVQSLLPLLTSKHVRTFSYNGAMKSVYEVVTGV